MSLLSLRARFQKGTATIEFAMGFLGLWFMCMMWVEMSYLSFLSAINDLAIAQSARTAKISKDDYKKVFEQTLKSQGSIWSYVANSDGFRLSVLYVKDMEDLEDIGDDLEDILEDLDDLDGLEDLDDMDDFEDCKLSIAQGSIECGDAEESAIAVYRTSYSYQPIFAFFMDGKSILSREVIVIQEYERSEFEV